jgi:hypothetical protein
MLKNVEDFDAYLAGRLDKKQREQYESTSNKSRAGQVWVRKIFSREYIQEYFEEAKKAEDRYPGMFDGTWHPEIGAKGKDKTRGPCPVFIASAGTISWNNEIIFNGDLSKVQFFRIVDPQQAYQRLSMWHMNQASPHKEPMPISDEEKAESKGFNKFSFRQDPSSKPKRKRKKAKP